jgi:16S rRNA (guanine527-N7)-methyltransferase
MRDFSNKYLSILKNELAGINLTRILDENEFYEKQIIDSILPLRNSPIFLNSLLSTQVIIDVGFGGGFPIIPLAHELPQKRFIGFEIRNKKVLAATRICELLGISNCNFFHQDISQVFLDIPSVVTLKAVGSVGDYLNKIYAIPETKVFFYKGPQYKSELEGNMSYPESWDLIEEIKLAESKEATRYLIGFERKNVPRRTPLGLVKLSTFF